ncbi:MAG: hypothetical protein HIU91_09010 [Acidobacteria bacterium]|nr:hypothetical protein [Acidobacteriota bacterium]
MWPSIAQNVVELLVPHLGTAVTRVFSKQLAPATIDSADPLAQSLRTDVSRISASHDSLFRQLSDQSDKLSTISSDTHSIKLQTAAIEDRLIALERRASTQQTLAAAILFLLAACTVLLLILLLHRP